MAHAGVQPDHYEGMHILVLILRRRCEQISALPLGQIDDADSDHDPQGLVERIQSSNLTDTGYSFNI